MAKNKFTFFSEQVKNGYLLYYFLFIIINVQQNGVESRWNRKG